MGFLNKSKKSKTSLDREIIINMESLETRMAILHKGKLEDFAIERSSEERIVGSIFKGKIQNLEDGLQAAFVDIGMKKNAFIHYWDMVPEDSTRLEAEEGTSRSRKSSSHQKKKKNQPGEMIKKFPIGSEIIVQVTKGAIGTKGPRVTANLSIPGRYLVMMPGSKLKGVSRKIADDKERQRLKKILGRIPMPEKIGFIIRTAGAGARKTSFVRDMRNLTRIWAEVEEGITNKTAPCCLHQEPDLIERMIRDSLTEEVDRILVDSKEELERFKQMVSVYSRRSKNKIHLYDGTTPIFEYFDIERQLENVLKRKVWLPSGGYIVFDETEALVAVDINTGRHKKGNSQEESIVQVNLEAADEVARQLRLRNVGGLVVIDFIDMRLKKHQNAVLRALKEAIRSDKARTNILPISELGLLEMTRQRADVSFRETTFSNCPYCNGRGKTKSALSMSVEIQRRINEVMRKQNEKEELALRISVNPAVLDRLRKEDEGVLIELEERHGRHLTFVADANIHMEDFKISDSISGKDLHVNQDH